MNAAEHHLTLCRLSYEATVAAEPDSGLRPENREEMKKYAAATASLATAISALVRLAGETQASAAVKH